MQARVGALGVPDDGIAVAECVGSSSVEEDVSRLVWQILLQASLFEVPSNDKEGRKRSWC